MPERPSYFDHKEKNARALGLSCQPFCRVEAGRVYPNWACIEDRKMTEVCVIAERLDCGDFSAAVGTRGYHLFFQSARPHESAAQAGAVQTLRAFPHAISIYEHVLNVIVAPRLGEARESVAVSGCGTAGAFCWRDTGEAVKLQPHQSPVIESWRQVRQ